jgi:hypothetical protein
MAVSRWHAGYFRAERPDQCLLDSSAAQYSSRDDHPLPFAARQPALRASAVPPATSRRLPETGKVRLDRWIDPASPPFYSTPRGEPTDRRLEAIDPLGRQIDGLDHLAPLRRMGLAMRLSASRAASRGIGTMGARAVVCSAEPEIIRAVF